jgi:hypothetical protein
MYTFNLFCFGHNLAKDPELNNDLSSKIDAEFSTVIHNNRWELKFPYHGGQINPPWACVLGLEISDSETKNSVQTLRSFKEEDYIDDYNKFLKMMLSSLRETLIEADDLEVIDRLEVFLRENSPEIYIVEVSS